MSDIDNLSNILSTYFYIKPADMAIALALGFTIFIAWLILNKTNNSYAALAGCFVPITIFTIIGIVPMIFFILISVSLSLLIAAKLLGVF